MSNRLFHHRLINVRAYVGLGGIAVIILYFVYVGILRLGIISPLGAEASFNIVSRIINFTFILAITAVVLSIISYTLPKILPAKFLAPLDPKATANLVGRVVDLMFTLGVIGTIFGTVSYALPKVLPASLFEPVPKIEYAVGIVKMFDPYDVSGTSKIMDTIELYPGFPYYSRESDHRTLWPMRVSEDRGKLSQQYESFLKEYPEEISRVTSLGNGESESSIKVLGGGYDNGARAQIEIIAMLRMSFYNTLGGDLAALSRYLGPEATNSFIEIEKSRAELRRHFPNRLALLRINNTGKRDARKVTIEFDLFGELYDTSINADPNEVRKAEYDRAKKRFVIEQILPGSQVEIRLWYRYYSVENRMFPDERDFILELTQGLVINNVVISDGLVALNEKLMEDFSAYESLYLGDAAKKDDYSEELMEYFEKKEEATAEHLKRYEEEHPSFKDVSPEWLAASNRPDESVNAIWVRFTSKSGESYRAIHVFNHPGGPYILLSSKDKEQEDFSRVQAVLAEAYQGVPDGSISDRGDDICGAIRVPEGFTQKGVAEMVETFFRNTFDGVAIESVHY